MKKTNIIYWIFTGLYAVLLLFSSIGSTLNHQSAVEMVSTHLGYPAYFIPFLNAAKFLGAIALLIPGFPRIKEWAYAGLTFDLIAAVYSIISVGDPISKWAPIIIAFIILGGSYIFYHKKLKAASLSNSAK